jgi:hypothetical protein
VPVVVLWMVVQVVALGETSMRYAVAYAASQFSRIRLIVAVPPRSTWSHCGSLNWLDQRVVARPSSAAAGALPPSCDEAVTGLNSEIGVPPGVVGPVVPKTWNSHSEYPHPVARAVPFTRT